MTARLALLCLVACQALHAQIRDTSVFRYQKGTIVLGDNLATLSLSDKYAYLDPKQTEFVLVNLWGNPPGFASLGMILPSTLSPVDTNTWAVIIQYAEEGYVKDNDAGKINYDDVLGKMQKSTLDGNKERVKQGYEPIELVGWAERPYYDSVNKRLFWGKELRFGSGPHTTLNYDIRILGRKGYLVMRVVSKMALLPQIKPCMPEIAGCAAFNPGNAYADYQHGVDKVSPLGIAALVAGGALAAKAGLFKGLLLAIVALKKFLIIGVVAALAFFRGIFRKKKPEEQVLKVKEHVRKPE